METGPFFVKKRTFSWGQALPSGKDIFAHSGPIAFIKIRPDPIMLKGF
jgi:hypothetical protein